MRLDDSAPCPGRTDLARIEGECRACTRLDNSAPVTAVPRTVYLKSLAQWVCEGRRFHGPRMAGNTQSYTPKGRGTFAQFVASRGDAR